MKDWKMVWAIVLFLTSSMVSGQTVELPDTNLRNKLLSDYPEVMEGESLSLAAAAAHTGSLDLRNARITDATGIEHFTGITSLDLTNNLLTSLPDLSAISGLVNFYATNNQLTHLPSLATMTHLRDFQVINNQLTSLPDLPEFSAELYNLYCSSNQITEIPELSRFPNLKTLVIGNNPIAHTIDYSAATNLTSLHIHKMNIDTITGLDKLKKLSILYAWGNSIRSFSGLDSITTLTKCVIYDNPIAGLPYMGNKPDLTSLAIANCHLTFEDIVPVLQLSTPPAEFSYLPQRLLSFENKIARASHDFALTYPVSNPEAGNIYVWLKNGEVVDSSSSASYTFTPLTPEDNGDYTLRVYNSDVAGLRLTANTFNLKVIPCIEFAIPFVNILSKSCTEGYSIDVSNARVAGGTEPYSYRLSNEAYNETFSEHIIENIPAGQYQITLTDNHGCTATDNFTLNRIEKCDPVITPNGDGIADTYFVESYGTVKIYDLRRRLVKTMEAPVVWDGTDQNGALLDAGYYILLQDGAAPVYITLIR